MSNSNRYSALCVEDEGEVDHSGDEIQVIENSTGNKAKTPTKTKSPSKPQDVGPHRHSSRSNGINNTVSPSQRKIAILGDSMIKHLNPRKLQHGLKHKVMIKTFPGAHVEDKSHYVKPTLATNPAEVILHIGTNDLKNKSPNDLLKFVDNLGEMITQSNDTKLTLSENIARSADESIANKVNLYNELLANLCIERNWGLIKNTNIEKGHLNNYGLHLK